MKQDDEELVMRRDEKGDSGMKGEAVNNEPRGPEGRETKPIDCQIFGDQLDALIQGDLPEEGMRQLRLHAGECPQCRMQLRVQEHLLEPSLGELEARVPDEMVMGMWGAVEAGVRSREGSGAGAKGPGPAVVREDPSSRHPFQGRGRWLVPTLAAATLALLFSTGFLYWQTARLQTRAQALAQQVEDQRYWLAELEVDGADPAARTAALAGRNPWSRALSRQDEITLGNLRSLLARAPGDRVILSQSQLDEVLRSRVPLSPPLLREALGGISGTDGVTARELLEALDGLGVSPDTTVPTEELMALFS